MARTSCKCWCNRERGGRRVKPIQLQVPLYHQERGIPHCSLWCLKMLYEYDGAVMEIEQLRSEVGLMPSGLYIQEVGRHAMGRGYQARLISADTTRLLPEYATMDGEAQQAALAARAEEYQESKAGIYYRGLTSFLAEGGRLEVRPPVIEDLLSELQAGRPLLCSLDIKALYAEAAVERGFPPSRRLGQVGHYVLVTGIDEQTVTLNDPSTWLGGVVSYSHWRFLYAVYSYQGYALALQPR